MLAQVVVALIDRDLVNPGNERCPKIEIPYPEEDLCKHLLRNIFHVSAAPYQRVCDGEHPTLVTLYQQPERVPVATLATPHQVGFPIQPRTRRCRFQYLRDRQGRFHVGWYAGSHNS